MIYIIKLLWYGLVKMAGKSSYVFAYYICLGILAAISMIASNIILRNGLAVIFIVSVFINGIRYYRAEILPAKKWREFFHKVFKELKFETEIRIPCFLSKRDITRFVTVYRFLTYFPLCMWNSKKDYIEMHMKAKILDIKHDERDMTIVNLYAQREPLPKLIKWDDKYINKNNILSIGFSRFKVIGMNLDKYPHAFIAGETGSGKSNILKCLIHQALSKNFDVVLIDFKRGVSFSEFSRYVTVYYDYKSVITVLGNIVKETSERLDKFRMLSVDNINDYNNVSKNPLNRMIIFIDELAELLRTKDKETARILNESIETLTRLSRAVGIHLIMGIQRPKQPPPEPLKVPSSIDDFEFDFSDFKIK